MSVFSAQRMRKSYHYDVIEEDFHERYRPGVPTKAR